jgi:hypothetical protein
MCKYLFNATGCMILSGGLFNLKKAKPQSQLDLLLP